jgi:dTDP-4-amino-4,6-dideoxygalactose transaminase
MISFNWPYFVDRQLDYVKEAFATGRVSGDGPFGRRAEAVLEKELGVPRVLLTTSCTHALEASSLLLDIGPGDEVILPSFTFVSTANAFALRGAKLVFADVRPDTLNIDETKLEALVTKRTKAIVAVHYAGVGCAMDRILELGVPVIEDNAHGLYGRYRGKPLGSFGVLATQSFHETKNVSCGEGGALVVSNPELIERAEILREKGTNRSRFFRGQVDKYTWVDIGSSWVLSDVLAAMLLAQLEERDTIQRARKKVWDRYAAELGSWAEKIGARLPTVPPECEQAYHMFHLLLPDLRRRTEFLRYMTELGIQAVFHYLPLHKSPMGAQWGGDCPVTEDVSDRLVRLPFHAALSESDQAKVIDAVRSFT